MMLFAFCIGYENSMEQQQVIIEESALPLSAHSLSTSEDTATTPQEKAGLTAGRQKEILKLCRQVQRNARFRRFYITIVLPSHLMLCVAFLLNSSWKLMPVMQAFFVITMANLLLPVMIGRMGYLSNQAKSAIKQLNLVPDLQSLGSLIEALASLDMREGAMKVLTTWLPQLHASDAPLLTEHHHRLLCQTLKRSGQTRFLFTRPTDRQFAIAVLKAFEQVGTSQAVPVVEYLSQKAADMEVRRAAEACLPFLQTRAEQEQNEQTLLRTSTSHVAATEELLRPTYGQNNEVNPEQLLRANSTE
jgi:hypothetical protein